MSCTAVGQMVFRECSPQMHIPVLEIKLLKEADATDALLYRASVTLQAENRSQTLT